MTTEKKNKWPWWKILLWCLPVFVLVAGWLIYRMIWTLAALKYLSYSGFPVWYQTNIRLATQWGPAGTIGQLVSYTPVTGWLSQFTYGISLIWMLPYLVISWGFWWGLVSPKPQLPGVKPGQVV